MFRGQKIWINWNTLNKVCKTDLTLSCVSRSEGHGVSCKMRRQISDVMSLSDEKDRLLFLPCASWSVCGSGEGGLYLSPRPGTSTPAISCLDIYSTTTLKGHSVALENSEF